MIARHRQVSIAACSIAAAMAIGGCTQPAAQDAQAKPQQAGEAMNPLTTAGRIAAVHGAAIIGDKEGVQRSMAAFGEDVRKSMKLADPARRVDHESARSAARRVDGVRSVVWLDQDNLFVIVSRNELRSYQTINEICLELESLGDTLGVVVNLQSGVARTGDELEILSRNCQLAPGDRAMLQRKRQVDVIAPEVRAEHDRNKAAVDASGRDHEAEAAESLRILEATVKEM
ncbi:MAG: hypothetical protein H0T88_04335 [Lysobacter sp.]|nr:hypothetical protein [Lysobacter sp.]